MTNRLNETRTEPKQVDQYHSVEFSVNGLVPYLFKIWKIASTFMTVPVKEGSDILPRLKAGDTLQVKCYSADSVCHPEYMETAIRRICRIDHGRFKGHYLVDLEISESQNQKTPPSYYHWSRNAPSPSENTLSQRLPRFVI